MKQYYVEFYSKLYNKTIRKQFDKPLDALDFATKHNGIMGVSSNDIHSDI